MKLNTDQTNAPESKPAKSIGEIFTNLGKFVEQILTDHELSQ